MAEPHQRSPGNPEPPAEPGSDRPRAGDRVAFALFREGEQMSRTFPSKEEALEKADQAGLVEHHGDKPVLEDELKIKPCRPDAEPHDDSDLDWAPETPAS